jgi:hypothetical protein
LVFRELSYCQSAAGQDQLTAAVNPGAKISLLITPWRVWGESKERKSIAQRRIPDTLKGSEAD